ncbi:MAG: 1-acyl-sn-glycerol-3-phosphate acyltransferase [Candidatus Limimorpha sp.]
MSNQTEYGYPSVFDDIRPYTDTEIPAAMQRLAQHEELFQQIADFFGPGFEARNFRKTLCAIDSVKAFQWNVMKNISCGLIKKTISDFTCSGFENIDREKPYLFVSNHRDIVLDAMLLQYSLVVNGFDTCQICFGSNLIFSPLFNDIGKSNKMFQVERGGNRLDYYHNLAHLSDYMRYVITQRKEPVWIAQRSGRTKNGIDATDPAIIKMFAMSSGEDPVTALSALNIVPVSVSYEWESCDRLKALELYALREGKYEKKPGEDLNSIITGIRQQKGHVHFHICQPISEEELKAFSTMPSNAFFHKVAALMDERINSAFALTQNNYIAHDLLSASANHCSKYTAEQKEAFLRHLAWVDDCENMDREVLRNIFLGIYANPVDSALRIG